MTIDDEIRNEKVQCNINKEAAKIPALPPGKIDKYEYLKKKKKIHDQRRMIEQAKFFHSSLLKFKKKSKQKQLKSMKKSSQI